MKPMHWALRPARACACGAGQELPLGVCSREPMARLVWDDRVIAEAWIATPDDIDRIEYARIEVGNVRCPACGTVAPATHVVVVVDGQVIGGDDLEPATLAAYDVLAVALARRRHARRGRLGPIPSEIPDSLPDDVT